MDGRFMSDRYVKRQRGAERATDNLMHTKNRVERTLCEEREAIREHNSDTMLEITDKGEIVDGREQ